LLNMDFLASILADEQARIDAFPICGNKVFMAHAAVTTLPRVVADAMVDFSRGASARPPDFKEALKLIQQTREVAARLIRAAPEEVALLGPTSLGLSLFANGIDWREGDEVLCYLDDYPANVYPWLNLRTRGVTVRFLEPPTPGAITPGLVEEALSPRTRLVALASCHFVSGYRIDIAGIGQLLRQRGVLFSLDAIQTLGAFPTTVEHVDFLSADAHKWLLGPLAIGIVFVRKDHFELCRPTLLGSWNIKAPEFMAQPEIEFLPTAQRYEPGALNLPGIAGMKAAIELLLEIGIEHTAERILSIRARLAQGLEEQGFRSLGAQPDAAQSGILTVLHPSRDVTAIFEKLGRENIVCSPRQDRAGTKLLRFSPHFYNTEAEVDRVLEALKD
jgi:cysteine desulfurase / selenocysteine lyase